MQWPEQYQSRVGFWPSLMLHLQHHIPVDVGTLAPLHLSHVLAQENDRRHFVCPSSAPQPSSKGSGKAGRAVLSRRLGAASRRLGKPRGTGSRRKGSV